MGPEAAEREVQKPLPRRPQSGPAPLGGRGGQAGGAARRGQRGAGLRGDPGCPPAQGRPREEVEGREGRRRASLTIGIGLGIEALAAASVVAQQGHFLFPPLRVRAKRLEPPDTAFTTPRPQPPVCRMGRLPASGNGQFRFRNLREFSGRAGAQAMGRGGGSAGGRPQSGAPLGGTTMGGGPGVGDAAKIFAGEKP